MESYTACGTPFLIDDEDYEVVGGMSWYMTDHGYIVCREMVGRKKHETYLHRLIMNFPDNKVDHKDGNKLDCRKANLRACTHQQNMFNAKRRKDNTTGYKGVGFLKNVGKYRARIRFNNKQIHIGHFDCPIKAAKAYDKKAKELHGEFARLNFP